MKGDLGWMKIEVQSSMALGRSWVPPLTKYETWNKILHFSVPALSHLIVITLTGGLIALAWKPHYLSRKVYA